MKKQDLSEVQVYNDVKRPTVGGYVCGIVDIVEKEEYNLFEVFIDIAEGEFKGYYTKDIKNTETNRKSYPSFAVFYGDKERNRSLNSFVTSVSKSNASLKINVTNPDTSDIMKCKKMRLGVVFGEEEFELDGKILTTVKPRYPHSVDAIKEGKFTLPKKKCLNQSATKASDDPFGTKPLNDTSLPFSEDTENDMPFGNEDNSDDLPFS